ncbi:MAG: chitobiase/beta-hexosaminidase C-terminal domain-containing protein [Nitrospinae bacterium]|nr:chitobiase/beta-hexosaminidase C-terminal domain-containing protein [Nitrospinota bacterium]
MRKKYFLPVLCLLSIFILHESNASAVETGSLMVIAQDTDGKPVNAPIEVKGEQKGKGTLILTLPKKKYTVLFGKMKGYALKTPKTGRQIASVEPGKTTIVTGIYESESQPGMVHIKKGSQDFYIDEYEYPNKASKEPTVKVDWGLAKALCSDLGKRLCTKEEWSAACGGPKGFAYPYGRIYEGPKCNGADADRGVAVPSGTMKDCVSEYGAFDMSGNVWEWTGTPESGVGLMGGNWSSLETGMTCSFFEKEDPAYKDDTIGFRCCKTVEEVDKTPPVTTASPGGGTYASAQSVTLSCSDNGGSGCAATWYTTDGSGPTNHSSRYSSPIPISSTTTLKFLSMDKMENIEPVKTEKYTISIAPADTTAPTTTASPGGGTYASAKSVTLSCKDNGGSGCKATYYTTNGTIPTAATGAVYSSAISISATTTLKFFSVDKARNAESVKTEKYTISIAPADTTAPTTTASPGGGTYNSAKSVTLSCSDNGGSGCKATYYTSDGSDPTESSPVYSSAITISATTTLKFFSVDKARNAESVKTEKYTISIAPTDTTAPTTTASPGGGTYNSAQSVTLSCADNGGSGCYVTYYTTDGSDPDTSSLVYASPISISATTTLKFFSIDKAGNRETVKTKEYVIKKKSGGGGGGTTVTDIDGNAYNTVTIGTQRWMKENLKVTKYRNGEAIPTTRDISAETSPKYQWAYNGNESNVSTYGRLYTWYAATDSRGVCPAGWHLPTDAEWTTLMDYLGGESAAGGKMKESGTTHWNSPNTSADNSSGFTALPGGYRYYDGSFYLFGYYGNWWSATEFSSTDAWDRLLYYDYGYVSRYYSSKNYGFSVRCVGD